MQQLENLGSVCEIQNGFAFKSSDYKVKGIPLLRISNFNDGEVYIDKKQIYVDEKKLKSKSDFIVSKGDILIALSGATTGKYGVYNFDFPSLLNQRIGVIKSGRSKSLFSRYFYYYLNILKKDILRQAGGAAQPNISTKKIAEFKIPLPPLSTQKRIAEILDNSASLRDKTKLLLEEYDKLAQSVFLEMFGDPRLNVKNFPQVDLGEILEIITYGLTVRPKYINKGIRLISARELKSGKLNLLVAPQISESDFKKLSAKGKPKKGEILFSKTGSIGHCVIIDTEEEFAITQNAARLAFKENINPIFALEQLRSSYFQTLCQQRAKGNAVKDLQLGDMKKLPFIVPPIHIQNQFAEKIAIIEQQKDLAKQELKESEDLFQALLQKAFKGELINEEKFEMKLD